MAGKKTSIVILGGGFAGVYTALRLEKNFPDSRTGRSYPPTAQNAIRQGRPGRWAS